MRFLRSRLRKWGYQGPQSVKRFTKEHFSEEIRQVIREVFCKFTSEQQRQDAFRLFDTWEGVKELRDAGWLIANHTASHYPVDEASALGFFQRQFEVAEESLQSELGEPSQCWVLPFDDPGQKSEHLLPLFR